MATVVRTADEEALAHAAAERLTTLIAGAVADRGSAVVALTGGRTPRRLYALLADGDRPWRARVDWGRLHLFWGDERHVPPEHPESNFGMADDALLRHVPIPSAQIHRLRGEMREAHDAAADYERELREGFALAGREDQTFDVMLLGLGEDAHIASVFPGSELLDELAPRAVRGAGRSAAANLADRRRVAAIFALHLAAWRLTLTPTALLDSRAIVMLVAGGKKADAVRAALQEPIDIRRWPAQLLRAAGDRVEWFVDAGAASRLRDE